MLLSLSASVFNSCCCYEPGSLCSDAAPWRALRAEAACTCHHLGVLQAAAHRKRQPVKVLCSLSSPYVRQKGCKEELASKAVMAVSHSDYWAFQVDWSGEKEKSREVGKGEFPSLWNRSVLRPTATFGDLSVVIAHLDITVGSVPEQIILAADSHFKVFDQVTRLERKQLMFKDQIMFLSSSLQRCQNPTPLKFLVDERVLWFQ